MRDSFVVIIRFSGDSHDLDKRFEQVRSRWLEAQPTSYEPPLFYATGETDEGIAVVTAWATASAHRAFGQALHGLIDEAGMPHPESVERLRVLKLGWD